MTAVPFGLAGAVAIAVYLIGLLGIGAVARRARTSDSLSDFYLAGRRLGPVVLVGTLYATQYSGNSLLGYPGEAYRLGFGWVMSVGFMMAIIVAYLLVAPPLYRVSRRFGYVTPGDWIDHRFGSPALSWTANGLWIVAVSNYLLAQLMAMGHIVAGLSDNLVPYWAGVVLFTLVMIVYESIGGMRAVAWTDVLQGAMLLVGLTGLLIGVAPSPARLAAISEWVIAHHPEKAAVPPLDQAVNWASTVLLIGLSACVYPQAVQRIYAALDLGSLKRSLSIMAFMPLVTMTPVLLVGIYGMRHFASLEGVAADQVMPMLLREWAAGSWWMYGMALLVLLAVVAAVMSTADSVLLSLSSILAKDVVGKTLARGASEERLTRIGKMLSWAVVAGLVGIALVPRITLWGLTELKMEVLSQIAPAFILGLRWPRLTAGAALAGMVAGFTVAMGLTAAGHARVMGIHGGIVGLAINVGLCVVLSKRAR